MENDINEKASSPKVAPVPPAPPAPSVQLAQVHGAKSCDAPDSEEGSLSHQKSPEQNLERERSEKRLEVSGVREKPVNAKKVHRENNDETSGGKRALLSDRRILVVVAGVLCLVCVVAIAAFTILPQAATDEARSDDRVVGSDSGRDSAVVFDTNATADAREASEAVVGQFVALSKNEDSQLTTYVQAFMQDYDAGVNKNVSYGFSDLGITADELSAKLQDGLSAEVVSVDVYGDKAWVEVSVVSRSFADQTEAFAAAMARGDRDFADEESYREYLKQELLGAFDEVEPRAHETLIVMEREDEGWQLSPENMASLLGTAWYG